MSTDNSSAGWYVNPAAGGEKQYWDGMKWRPEILLPVGSTNVSVHENQNETSKLAIASFVTAFVAPTIVPIVLGHLARADIKRSNGLKSGDGLALAGLIIGYVTTAILFVFFVALFSSSSDSSPSNEYRQPGSSSNFDCGAAEYYIGQGTASDVLIANYLANCN